MKLIVTLMLASLLTIGASADGGIIDILPSGNATYVINTPGSYRLAGNVTNTVSEEVIRIEADDVTLDLNGHTIDQADSLSFGVRIAASRSEVFGGTVVGGKLAGFAILDGQDHHLHDVTSLNSANYGIYVNNTSRVLVEDVVSRGHTWDGLVMTNTTAHITVRDSLFEQNRHGIYVSVTGPHLIQGNHLAGNSNRGIVLNATSHVVVKDNTMVDNGGDGIWDSAGTGNLIVNNFATGNAIDFNTVPSVTSQAVTNEWGDNVTP